MKIPGWVCDLGNGEFDHDWKLVSDWGGDPDVIGGTFDCSFKRCEQCGEEAPLEHNDPILQPDPDWLLQQYRDDLLDR